MIEQIEVSANAAQMGLVDSQHRQELMAMTDLELRQAFERLSGEIETRKTQGSLLTGNERLEWEIDLLGAMYRRESIQFEQLSRSMAHLDQCWTAARVRQGAYVLEGVSV